MGTFEKSYFNSFAKQFQWMLPPQKIDMKGEYNIRKTNSIN